MNDSKEFLGKSLDAAIAEACSFYDVPREKLEIDIIEDAKTGIFGIVGARKARIHARLATLPDFLQNPAAPAEPRAEGKRRRSRREKAESGEQSAPSPQLEAPLQEELPPQAEAQPQPEEKEPAFPAPEIAEPALPAEEAPEAPEMAPQEEAPKSRRARAPRQPRAQQARAPRVESAEKAEEGAVAEALPPLLPLSELDQEALLEQARSVLSHLVAPILDITPEEVDLTVEICGDRVQASVKSEETGLLIGRDGQNLAAVQYLASRIITRGMGAQVRVQVDAGDYHMRQDSRLQELALSLAEKVKATGKTQTTRPLSAYQRRVIHLTLQDDPEVQTRSSGEGPLKHVVILRRKD